MEAKRVAKDGELNTPLWVKAPFVALCWVLGVLYEVRVRRVSWIPDPRQFGSRARDVNSPGVTQLWRGVESWSPKAA